MYLSWGAVIAWIRNQIGLRGDAADSAGTLNAKLKSLAEVSLPVLQKPGHTVLYYTYVPNQQDTWHTLVEVASGKGRITSLVAWRPNSSSVCKTQLKVTIDGNIVCAGRFDVLATGWHTPNIKFFLGSDPDLAECFIAEPGESLIDLAFNASLKVEAYVSSEFAYNNYPDIGITYEFCD